MEILFASSNTAKIERIKKLIHYKNMRVLSLSDLEIKLAEPEETGKDAVENSKIKAAYYYKKTGKKYPVLAQDDTMNLFGIDPTEDPGVSIKQPVLKEFGDFNDTNAYKYYGNLAAKYGGKIELQFNYGHALAFAEKVIALPSKLKGILVAEVSKQRTPGYFLADMVKVKINGEWRYYNSLSDCEILLRDSDLAQSINSLLRRL